MIRKQIEIFNKIYFYKLKDIVHNFSLDKRILPTATPLNFIFIPFNNSKKQQHYVIHLSCSTPSKGIKLAVFFHYLDNAKQQIRGLPRLHVLSRIATDISSPFIIHGFKKTGFYIQSFNYFGWRLKHWKHSALFYRFFWAGGPGNTSQRLNLKFISVINDARSPCVVLSVSTGA